MWAARPDAARPGAGVLACLDPYMNLAMEQTEEYVEGELKNKYGDCFLRGNNGAGLAGQATARGEPALCHDTPHAPRPSLRGPRTGPVLYISAQ